MKKVAEQIAEFLKQTGVHYVFGIPSGPWTTYMDAFRAAGLEFVLVSNEASAGFMAEVFGRLTGVPGVCYGTLGPGATNLSTGVGGALLDRSPLIAFTTEPPDSMIGRTTQMAIWVVRPIMESGGSVVKAIRGDLSRSAPPTPVLRFVAPGPRVP